MKAKHYATKRFSIGRHAGAVGVVVCAGLGLAGEAVAGPEDYWVRSEFAANRAMNSATNANMTWASRAAVNGWEVGKAFDMAAPGGRKVAAEYAVKLASRDVALAAAQGLASRVILPLAVATLAWDVYDHFRTRPDGAGGLVMDPGEPPVTGEVFCHSVTTVNGPIKGCGATPDAALSDLASKWPTQLVNVTCVTGPGQGYPSSFTPEYFANLTTGDATGREIWERHTVCNETSWSRVTGVQYPHPETNEFCPSGSVVGFDGKCETGEYTTPISAQEAADMLAAHEHVVATLDYKALLDEALNGPKGVALKPELPAELRPQVGNAFPFVPGATTTTTHPDGSKTTVATGWNLARDPLRPKEGVFTPTSTTTKTNAAGDVIEAPTVTTSEGDPGTDAEDPCIANPDRLGCLKVGEVPTDEVPKISTNVPEFRARNLSGLPVGCPADVVIDGHAFSYAMVCDTATQLRPWMLISAAFSALMLVVAAVRSL